MPIIIPHRLLLLAILLIAIPGTHGQNVPPEQSAPVYQNPVKNGTAPGRYGGGGGGGGYSADDKSGEYEVAYGHSQRLIDDYICDLDASILVVTNSEKAYQKSSDYGDSGDAGYGQKDGQPGYGKPDYAAGRSEAKRSKRGAAGYGNEEEGGGGGYGEGGGGGGYGKKGGGSGYGHTNTYSVAKAHRLRCSAIAVNSDEDCKKCCHMAAKKERSISKESIVGFIVDYDEVTQSENGYQPASPPSSGPYRMKRGAEEVAYPPAAKPDDYQYDANGGQKQGGEGYGGGGGGGYGDQKEDGAYGGGEEGNGGYGGGDQGGYQQKSSSYSYNYPQKPKNPRCVCCAPKTYSPSSSSSSSYGSPSNYGHKGGYGGKAKMYGRGGGGGGYNNNEGGYESAESGEQEEYGREREEYGPPRKNYGGGGHHGGGYGSEEEGREYGKAQKYGDGGRGYGRNGRRQHQSGKNYGGRGKGEGPY